MTHQVYNDIAEQRLLSFGDNFFDLAIVDPPYGINAPKMGMGSSPTRKDGKGYPSTSTAARLRGRLNTGSGKLKNRALNTMDCSWDKEPPGIEFFSQLFRVSQNQIIFGGNYFPLMPSRCWICWDKKQPWKNFSQFELAWTSFDYPSKMYRISNTGGSNKVPKIHPTQKPILLYDMIYSDFVKPGMKILDTHLGSGTHRITAWKNEVEFYGIEKDPVMYKKHMQFFENQTIQGRINWISNEK